MSHNLIGRQSNGPEDADRMRKAREHEVWLIKTDRMTRKLLGKDTDSVATIATWIGIGLPSACIIIIISGLWTSKWAGWIP